MLKFLVTNSRFPLKSPKVTVIAQFVVKKTGEIDSIKIMRGDNPEWNEEAIRLLKLMPKWNPGRYNGQVKNTYFTLPFRFGEAK